MEFAVLCNVCNGGQIWNLDGVTEGELDDVVDKHKKVVCVINRFQQKGTKKLFQKIARQNKGPARAKRLAFWNSDGAELWLIYQPRCGTRPC